ncbi:MAG: hypothetical protein ACK4PR_04395 [Gammaproteobacteria bacterium]
MTNMLTEEQAKQSLESIDKILKIKVKKILAPFTVKPINIDELCQDFDPNEPLVLMLKMLVDSTKSNNNIPVPPPMPLPKLNTPAHQLFFVGIPKSYYKTKESLQLLNIMTKGNILFPCSDEKNSMEWLELIERIDEHFSLISQANLKQVEQSLTSDNLDNIEQLNQTITILNNKTLLVNALKTHFQALVANGHSWAYPYLIAMDLYALLAARQVYEGMLNMQTFFALNLAVEQFKNGVIPLLKSLLIRFVDYKQIDKRFDYRHSSGQIINDSKEAMCFLRSKIRKETLLSDEKNKIIHLEQLITNCDMMFKQLSPKSNSQPEIYSELRHSPAPA